MSGRVNQNSLKICITKRLTTYIVGKRTHWTVIFSFNGNEYGKTLKTEHHIIDIMWFLHSGKGKYQNTGAKKNGKTRIFTENRKER